MASISYYGDDVFGIKIQTADDLGEALDLLHTQVLDNIGETPKGLRLLALLGEAMEAADKVAGGPDG